MWKSKKIKFILTGVMGILIIGFISFFYLGKDEFPPEDSDFRLSAIEIPKEENAFYDFNQAVEKIYWPKEKTDLINNIIRGKEWNGDFVEEIIEKNKETFFNLDKALTLSKFQLPEFQDPEALTIDTPFPSMGGWRNIARLNSIKALYLFNQRKEKEAFEEAIKIIKLSQLIKDSPRPILIQYLVASAMKKIGLETIRTMTSKTNLSPEILKSYAKELSYYKTNKSGVKTILKGEYIIIAKELKRPSEEILAYFPTYLKLMMKIPFYYKPNQTKRLFLESFRKEMENFDKDYYYQIKTPELEFQSVVPLSFPKIVFTENLIGKLIYKINMIGYTEVFSIQCIEDFSTVGTQLLITLRAYKINNGKLPSSLEELIPEYISEIPKDSFNGKPIRFSVSKKIIYSVGSDLIDSGGDEGEDWERLKDPTFKIEF